MTLQTRRNALLALAAGSAAIPVLLGARAAQAQAEPLSGAGYDQYIVNTLTVGMVAMQTSELALQKATNPEVKEFAQLEVNEQRTIASVLAATDAGKTPPQLPPERQATIQQLNDMPAGGDWDLAYLEGQLTGHNELLQIQQTISGESQATIPTITARLAEQAVASHISMLNLIQQFIGNQRIQNVEQGQNPAGGAAPAGAAPAPATR